MRSLIMDLLDFTKIRLERKEDKIERLDLEERAHLAISTIKLLAIQRNISIKYEGQGDLFFEADPMDLDIMMNNLLSNAVKYNRDGGSVVLQVSNQDGKMEIAVQDSGYGMTEREVSQLFQEFVRIKNKRTKGISGSGLGLSIVQKIAELYGGHILVESEPDKGSIFRVILPIQ